MKKSSLEILPKNKLELKGWPWSEETDKTVFNTNTDWPKITIITPSFNQGEFLEETIRSVLLQNYPNLEYIIIDGGSTDESVEIIKKYEPWISYWVSEKDRGQSHAINKGLRKTSGDIVNWLNSDDFYEPQALLKIANKFKESKNIEAVLGVTNVFGGDEKNILSKTPFGDYFYNFSKAKIEQPATFFSGNFFKEINQVDEDLHLAMDLDIWIKFLLSKKLDQIAEIDDVIVNFRKHEDSKTVNNVGGMIVERATLLHEVILSIDKKNGRYSHLLNNTPKDVKKEIIKGCIDFQLFWYKNIKQPEYKVQLKNLLKQQKKTIKQKIELFLK